MIESIAIVLVFGGLVIVGLVFDSFVPCDLRRLCVKRPETRTIRILVVDDGVRTEACTTSRGTTGEPLTVLETRAAFSAFLREGGVFDLHVATWHVVEFEIPVPSLPVTPKGSSL